MFVGYLSINHAFQKQSIARHALSGSTTIATCHYVIKFGDGDAMATHLNQSANNGSHHVSQKTIGRYPEMPDVRCVAYPSGFGDVTQCGFCIRMALAKSTEIIDKE